MRKYLSKILIGLVLAGGFVLFANGVSAVEPVIKFEFENPFFQGIKILPGNSEVRWIKVTNLNSAVEKIAIEARNFDGEFPEGDLARALTIEIKDGEMLLYGPKSLLDFYKDSGSSGGEDEKEIYLADLASGATRRYDVIISFPKEKGNEWQGRTTGFDVVVGYQKIGQDQTNSGGDTYTFIDSNGGGGGVGGFYDETGAKVAGISIENQELENNQQGDNSAILPKEGKILAGEIVKTVQDKLGASTEIGNNETEPKCEKKSWWPAGYFVYAVLILLLALLGFKNAPLKILRLVGQSILLIVSLLWWWFEPCGTLIWWQPVLVVAVSAVVVKWHLWRVANYRNDTI